MSDMKTDGRHRVKFKSIDVCSYKGIDSLSIVFPNHYWIMILTYW